MQRYQGIYQYISRIREPGPGATAEDLIEEHARRLPHHEFHQTTKNQRYVEDAVEIFEQGTILDSGEPGALVGLTVKEQEELRKQVKQGAQVIREVVVIEQEGPGAPEVVTSHRERVTHKLRLSLDADKDKKRRPRNHCWGSPKHGQNRDGKKSQVRTPVKAPSPAPKSPCLLYTSPSPRDS